MEGDSLLIHKRFQYFVQTMNSLVATLTHGDARHFGRVLWQIADTEMDPGKKKNTKILERNKNATFFFTTQFPSKVPHFRRQRVSLVAFSCSQTIWSRFHLASIRMYSPQFVIPSLSSVFLFRTGKRTICLNWFDFLLSNEARFIFCTSRMWQTVPCLAVQIEWLFTFPWLSFYTDKID